MISSSSSSDDRLVELVSILFSLLRPSPPTSPRRRRRTEAAEAAVSPAGFAWLLLGASLALMLCGSVALVLGFILMPWALGIILFLQLVGVVSNLSRFWMSVLCPIRKEISSGTSFLMGNIRPTLFQISHECRSMKRRLM